MILYICIYCNSFFIFFKIFVVRQFPRASGGPPSPPLPSGCTATAARRGACTDANYHLLRDLVRSATDIQRIKPDHEPMRSTQVCKKVYLCTGAKNMQIYDIFKLKDFTYMHICVIL